MVTSIRQIQELLRKRGMMTVVPTAGVPSLVEEVCDRPLRGSWWSLPNSGIIYSLVCALEGASNVLTLALLDGKQTFVHRALWPALLRFATDADRRSAAVAALRPPSRELLDEVERNGEVSFAGRPPPRTAVRAPLEQRWLCLASSEHTENGRHAAVFRSWTRWADEQTRQRAEKLTFEQARRRLLRACGDLGLADLGAAPEPPRRRAARRSA